MPPKLTELEADEYQRHGQELYRQGKYQAALQRFNALVQQDRKIPLKTLDSRAATFTKLGNLQAALRDGRTMIQEYKKNCSGYLRTGQVLQLLGKQDAALNIYQYGIRNVPPMDPKRELIQGMCDKLIKRCCPPRAVDPLQVLPVEITRMIFDYLDFKTIINLSTVSQLWRSFSNSTPKLWSDLDFSGTKKGPPVKTVATYIKRSCGGIVNAKLSGYTLNPSVLKCIATRCKVLTRLELCGGLTCGSLVDAAPALRALKTLLVSDEISLDAVTQILSHCSSLETAKFFFIFASCTAEWAGDLSRLRSLSLTTRWPRSVALPHLITLQLLQAQSLIPKIKHIRELELENWSHTPPRDMLDVSSLTELEKLNLANVTLGPFPPLPQAIQTLNISGLHRCRSPDVSNNARLEKLTRLVMGTFEQYHGINSIHALYTLLSPNKGNLIELDMTSCTEITSDHLMVLASTGYFSRIEKLYLPKSQVNDDVAEALATNLPYLRILNVSQTKITGVGIKSLVEKPGAKLQRLYLEHCESVGIDAVEYARARGIRVKFGFPGQ